MDKYEECYHCSKRLFGHPKIAVLTGKQGVKQIYCFHCAKKFIHSMTPSVIDEHVRRLNSYLKLKYEYDEKIKVYNTFQKESKLSTFQAYVWLLIIVISILMIFINLAVGVIIFVFSTGLITSGNDKKIKDKQDAYKKANPIIDGFQDIKPTIDKLWSTIHHPLPSDGSITCEGYDKYRFNILLRDNYTCQKCGLPFSGDNLEVHHIIPKSNHGTDNPTNLVTLCLDCHDKETWYGHFRVNRRVNNVIRTPEPGTYTLDESKPSNIRQSKVKTRRGKRPPYKNLNHHLSK